MGESESVAREADARAGRPPLPETKAEVQARREALRVALVDLEDLLSRPAGDPELWADHLRDGVAHMHEVLQQHVRETEDEGGLLAQLEADAPWLEGRVDLLRKEHSDLLQRTAALLADCRRGEVETARDDGLELLRAISRHRLQGSDLLYDAYMVDISAAD